MKNISIHHHLGLGDHFVCNGLVRAILEKESPDFLYLPVKFHNMTTVSQMYSDDRRVICIPVENDEQVYRLPQLRVVSAFYRIGFETYREDWDVSFYDAASLPFEFRWSKWRCARDVKKEQALETQLGISEPYTLIHDTGSNGRHRLEINTTNKIVRVEPLSESLFDWCGVIEKAEQVHCIDSSVIHLAQSIRATGVFHKIRDAGKQHFRMKAGWETRKYE